MTRKRYSPEQIIRLLREAEVFIAKGMTALKAACRKGVVQINCVIPVSRIEW